MDKLSTAERSRVMSAVHGKNTKPEIKVRSALHALGFRFRLHRKDLPGKPDIALPKYRTCIFVHGCFWHQHPGCKRATKPTSNMEFWSRKLQGNIERDGNNISRLHHLGWRVLVIWECETKNLDKLKHNLSEFLNAEGESHWTFFNGNYQEYEADKRKRLGEEGAKPKRIRYKPISR